MKHRFISAREALSDMRQEDLYEAIELDPEVTVHAGPSPDFQRSEPYHLARAQLDQMVRLLTQATGIHDPLVMTEQTHAALRRWAYAPHPEVREEYLSRLQEGQPTDAEHWDVPSGVDAKTGLVEEEWWEYELHVVRDALTLRQCLEDVEDVTMAYAIDGSVSLEIGPEYPEALATLNLNGNPMGELLDEPHEVFRAAVRATMTVAEILANSRYSPLTLSYD